MAKNTTSSKAANTKTNKEDVSGMQYENKAAYKNSESSKAKNSRAESENECRDCRSSYKTE